MNQHFAFEKLRDEYSAISTLNMKEELTLVYLIIETIVSLPLQSHATFIVGTFDSNTSHY